MNQIEKFDYFEQYSSRQTHQGEATSGDLESRVPLYVKL